jgi:hypothetical protein
VQASWAAESTRPDLAAITQALQNTSIAFTSVWGDHVTTTKLSAKLSTPDAPGAFTGSQVDLISQAWNSPMADQHFGCGELEDVWQYQFRVQRDFPKVDVTFEIFYLQCVAGGAGRISPKCPPGFCHNTGAMPVTPGGDASCECCSSPAWAASPAMGNMCKALPTPAPVPVPVPAPIPAPSAHASPTSPPVPSSGCGCRSKGTTATDLWCQQVQCAPVYNNVCTSACLR